jgi:hypothetical protein
MEVKPLLTISGFRELENKEYSIRIHKVTKSETEKGGKFRCGTCVDDVSKFQHFGISVDRKSRLLS